MPKLPPVSGAEIVRALERLGYVQVLQRGSHAKLVREGVVCIVPLHREVKRGTLAGVLRQANMSADAFLAALDA